ncbi:MAG: ISL3 family transposase, partial [bacterium]|nr:ISL3 family transposase [bacterium]
MLVKTILNRVHKFASFVYDEIVFCGQDDEMSIEVHVRPRAGSRPICSGCDRRRSGYDTLEPRSFNFVPLWAIPVIFIYAMRRVDCPTCGVRVERVPWAEGKSPLTRAYAIFLAQWAHLLTWTDVAKRFHTSWQTVFRAVESVVDWGLAHRDLDGIESIGVDEVHWHRGQNYLTLVYQIDSACKRLLWIGEQRTIRTLLRFFREFGKQRSAQLKYVCSDMWQAYLKVLAKKAPQAIHVLD